MRLVERTWRERERETVMLDTQQIAGTGTLAWVMFGLSSVVAALAVALSFLMLRTQVKKINKFIEELLQLQICSLRSLESHLLPQDLVDDVVERFHLKTELSGKDAYMDNLKEMETSVRKVFAATNQQQYEDLHLVERLPSHIRDELPQTEMQEGGQFGRQNRLENGSSRRRRALVDPLDPNYQTLMGIGNDLFDDKQQKPPVAATDPNYMTLCGIDGEVFDQSARGPGKQPVAASDPNYMTLCGLQGDVFDKSARAGQKPPVSPMDPNYQTLAGLHDDIFFDKDEAGTQGKSQPRTQGTSQPRTPSRTPR